MIDTINILKFAFVIAAVQSLEISYITNIFYQLWDNTSIPAIQLMVIKDKQSKLNIAHQFDQWSLLEKQKKKLKSVNHQLKGRTSLQYCLLAVFYFTQACLFAHSFIRKDVVLFLNNEGMAKWTQWIFLSRFTGGNGNAMSAWTFFTMSKNFWLCLFRQFRHY